jgi:hypothetical protein
MDALGSLVGGCIVDAEFACPEGESWEFLLVSTTVSETTSIREGLSNYFSLEYSFHVGSDKKLWRVMLIQTIDGISYRKGIGQISDAAFQPTPRTFAEKLLLG